MLKNFTFILVVGLFLLFSIRLAGEKPVPPNILVVDGQTGATYAMTRCDEWGNFIFNGLHPGHYLLKAEIDRSVLSGSQSSDSLAQKQLIDCGFDKTRGTAIFKAQQRFFIFRMDMNEVPTSVFIPEYQYVSNENFEVVTFLKASFSEVSTLQGTLKKTSQHRYQKLLSSKSMESCKDTR